MIVWAENGFFRQASCRNDQAARIGRCVKNAPMTEDTQQVFREETRLFPEHLIRLTLTRLAATPGPTQVTWIVIAANAVDTDSVRTARTRSELDDLVGVVVAQRRSHRGPGRVDDPQVQVSARPRRVGGIGRIGIPGDGNAGANASSQGNRRYVQGRGRAAPVSYTHLDVYKRQLQADEKSWYG